MEVNIIKEDFVNHKKLIYIYDVTDLWTVSRDYYNIYGCFNASSLTFASETLI